MKVRSRMRKITGAAAAAALIVGICSFASPALANTTTSHDDMIAEMEASLTTFLTERGVPATTQDALFDKLVDGVPLDSMTGAVPVSTTSTVEAGFQVTESVYADGSVSVSRIEIGKPAPAPGTITPFGVSQCGTTNGNGVVHKSNCLIDRWDGIVQQNFRADFTFVDNGYDRIDSIYSQSAVVYGASSWSQRSFSIGKKYENASGPARAEYGITAQTALGTFSYGLGLRVGASIGGQQYTF